MLGLELIDGWPVEHAAAAVVGLRAEHPQRLATHGDQDRPFPLASVTKLLTAYAVLVAVEETTIALDDSAGDVGPSDATVAHLLAHASGLGADGREVTVPGRRRIYSNAGFELLADLVALGSGLAFADYLTESVLVPLDMDHTRLEGSPAYGAVAPAADLARFAGELLRPTLVDRSTLDHAIRVAFAGLAGVLPGYGRQDPNDWGLGFELRDDKSRHWTGAHNSPRTFGHFGQSGTFLWVDPDAGLALVCLTDREFGPWAKACWPALSDAVLAAAAADT